MAEGQRKGKIKGHLKEKPTLQNGGKRQQSRVVKGEKNLE